MANQIPTLEYIKRQAKKLSKERSITHTEALEILAQQYQFSNWTHCQRTLKTDSSKTAKPVIEVEKEDERKITYVKNVNPLHFSKRSVEKFNVGDKAWISWNGSKAIPVTILEKDERHYTLKIERPRQNGGNVHYLFLDEVRSTPELACLNMVTM